MLVDNRRRVVLALHIDRNVLHRTGAIERDNSNDVFKIVGPHLLERVPHARAFELEHAECLATCHQVIGRLVIKALPFGPDIPAIPANQFQSAVDDGERLQAEEVELNEPRHLGILHVELRCRKIRARIII